MAPSADSTAGVWHATCLVVPPPRKDERSPEAVEQLIGSLGRRGLTTIRCIDCFDAMADVVIHERARREGKPSDPLVVILIDPREHPMPLALYETVIKQGYSTVFWEFHGGPGLRLTAFRPPPIKSPLEPELKLPPTPMVARGISPGRAAERHPLRLTSELDESLPDLEGVQTMPDQTAHADHGSLLTDEELSMLLGEGPDTEWAGDAGGVRA